MNGADLTNISPCGLLAQSSPMYGWCTRQPRLWASRSDLKLTEGVYGD
jgi:hypothetical protein